MIRAAWRGSTRLWILFGGANFLLNSMAICVVAGMGLLAWWFYLEPITPLQEAELTRIEPENRIVDRDRGGEMTLTRRVCMQRGAWGTATRYFVSGNGDGLEFKLASTKPQFFQAGCHDRTRTQEIPNSLPPGIWTLRTSIAFCNKVRCEEAWVQDVPFVLRGPWPVQPVGPAPPLREPL